MKASINMFISLILAFSLTACDEPIHTAAPEAISLPEDAVGYFCGMIVKNHEGPKGHVFVEGQEEPYWFTSVRDALAFSRLPEETAPITAIYVSDMGMASSWAQPGDDAWMLGTQAYFVVGSAKKGGMGAAEAVPFSTQAAAEEFVSKHGGTVMRLDDIPTDHLLGSDQDSDAHEAR